MNGYSDLIITDADQETFDHIVNNVESLMSSMFFDADGESKTDIIARDLRLNNFSEETHHNIVEYAE